MAQSLTKRVITAGRYWMSYPTCELLVFFKFNTVDCRLCCSSAVKQVWRRCCHPASIRSLGASIKCLKCILLLGTGILKCLRSSGSARRQSGLVLARWNVMHMMLRT